MKDKILILLLILLSIPTWISLARPGYYPMHDDMQAMRLLELQKCFSDGQVPCRWVPDMGYGYGYPQFNYYGPTPYLIMYFFRLLGFSILDSVKVFVIFISFLGLTLMYLLGKSLWGRWGGFFSSLVFLYAPYRAVEIYVRGAMGELTALSVAPGLFWGIKRIVEKKRFGILFFAFLYSILLTSHNISTMLFTPFLLVWSLLLIVTKKENIKNKLILFVKIFSGFFWAFLISAYFLLPAFLEKKYAHVETLLLGYFDYRRHFVSIKQLLINSFWGYGSSELGKYDGLSLCVGLIIWILPILILISLILFKKKKGFINLLFFLGVGWTALFMCHAKSSFIWAHIDVLKYVQFPWRFLGLATISFSIGAGAVNLLFIKRKEKLLFGLSLALVLGLFYGYFFRPLKWLNITDNDKFSGENWDQQMTISIYDYLPIYATHPPSEKAPGEPQIIAGEANILNYNKGSDWSKAQIKANSDEVLVRESIFYFPGWSVFVNGERQMIDYNNELGLITYEVHKGVNNVDIKLMNTPIRNIGNMFSLLALGFIPFYLVYFSKYEKED
jgi:hypothetical protein